MTVTASGLAKDMGLPGHCSSHSQYTAAIEAELKKLNQHFLAGRLSDTQLALGVGRIQNMAREGLETIPLHTSRRERLVNCRGLPFTLAFCAAREWHEQR
ncbi:hypothetical protein, partial [Burkholderia ubonensis]|uniref:hypothetical protein n=2 Tax=Burkholderia ubonensis TaxID=101571 RepID=UPI001E631C2B